MMRDPQRDPRVSSHSPRLFLPWSLGLRVGLSTSHWKPGRWALNLPGRVFGFHVSSLCFVAEDAWFLYPKLILMAEGKAPSGRNIQPAEALVALIILVTSLGMQ